MSSTRFAAIVWSRHLGDQEVAARSGQNLRTQHEARVSIRREVIDGRVETIAAIVELRTSR